MSTATNGRPVPITPSTSTSATRSWSVHDASELYEVARWGNGYFSVNDSGHVQVHPTKDPASAIDLKELVDRLQLRGISLPVLIRSSHTFKPITTYGGKLYIKVNQQRQVVEEVSRLRQAVQLRPRGRLEAGAAGRDGDGRQRHADHLQRLQGRRVHRDGDARPEDRAQHHPGRREVHRAGADPRGTPRRWASGRRSACASSWPRAAAALAVVGRLPLEVRPDGHRDHARRSRS